MRPLIALTLLGIAGLAPAPAYAATASAPRACAPVVNPYEGTRYEGSDLFRIRATGTSCRTARRVVRRGHRKALAAYPDPQGIVRVKYRRWSIVGDLRGDHDRYVATAAGGKRVTWRF